MIPGVNLLNMALTVIAKQPVIYYRDAGRVQNIVGQDITVYDTPVEILGSWQAVQKNLYKEWGLDLQKDYYVFYTSNPLIDVGRDVSGDQIALNGQRFQCESTVNWYPMDGWVGVLCIHIGLDTQDQQLFGFSNKNNPNTYTNFGNGNFPADDL